jgi:hypothetical protein
LGIGVILMDISLWGLDINHKDHLVFGGCDVLDPAGEYGTPRYFKKGFLFLSYQGVR